MRRETDRVALVNSSHNHTFGAAAGFGFVFLHVHGLGDTVASRIVTATSGVTLYFAVIPSDLANNIVKSLIDIDSGLGGSLDKLAPKRAGQGFALC